MLCCALRDFYAAKDKLSKNMFENISVDTAPITNTAKSPASRKKGKAWGCVW